MPKKLTQEEFIEKAKAVHGDKYCYDKAVYVNARSVITVICNKHGEFYQTSAQHLSGRGCKLCYSDKLTLTTDIFVERSNVVHNNFFNYDKTEYVDSRLKVLINCPLHGDFLQTPNSHLAGNKCPSCSSHGFNVSKDGFLYVHKVIDGNELIGYKIGITNQSVNNRLKSLKRNSLFKIENILSFESNGQTIYDLESRIHSECRLVSGLKDRMPDGHTEVIHPDDLELALSIIGEVL